MRIDGLHPRGHYSSREHLTPDEGVSQDAVDNVGQEGDMLQASDLHAYMIDREQHATCNMPHILYIVSL